MFGNWKFLMNSYNTWHHIIFEFNWSRTWCGNLSWFPFHSLKNYSLIQQEKSSLHQMTLQFWIVCEMLNNSLSLSCLSENFQSLWYIHLTKNLDTFVNSTVLTIFHMICHIIALFDIHMSDAGNLHKDKLLKNSSKYILDHRK